MFSEELTGLPSLNILNGQQKKLTIFYNWETDKIKKKAKKPLDKLTLLLLDC